MVNVTKDSAEFDLYFLKIVTIKTYEMTAIFDEQIEFKQKIRTLPRDNLIFFLFCNAINDGVYPRRLDFSSISVIFPIFRTIQYFPF